MCPGRGENRGIVERLPRALPAAVSLTHQRGLGLIKAQRMLSKEPTADNCPRLRLSRLPHEKEMEALYLSPSSSQKWHSKTKEARVKIGSFEYS